MGALLLLLFALWPLGPALGQAPAGESGELDSFWLGIGTSNVTQGDSFELGIHIDGAFRFGTIGNQFAEIGYTTTYVTYNVNVGGLVREASFRTTGPFVSYGVLIPVRNRHLGLRAMVAAVAFEEELADRGGAVVTEESGSMVDAAGMLFFVLARIHEVGLRYDSFVSNKSTAQSAFGVFYNIHFQ
ncbi:MAG TPA: hypothetical protein VGC20_12590 [bacterium]